MVNLTVEMPEEALSVLRETPERFAAELRFAAAVQWYHQGRISGRWVGVDWTDAGCHVTV